MKMTKMIKRVLVSLCCAVFGLMMGLIVCINAPFLAKANEIQLTTTADMYCDGASIRLNEDGANGIRFHVRVKANEAREALLDGVTYSEEEFNALTTGILLIPSNKLASDEILTIEGATTAYASGAKAANVTGDQCVWNFNSETESEVTSYYYEATAYIYNIPESNYENNFTFRGYYSVDGENYVYTKDVEQRSVAYVALMAKDDYQGEYTTQLNSFLPQRVAVNANFTRTSNYIYRVGNQNEVAFASLFTAKKVFAEDEVALGLDVKTEAIQGVVTAHYASESESFSFEGTGIVKITVTETYSRKAAELLLEVIDATNITSATDATDKDVVLLNDIGASSLNISGGHTFYGNGFKVSFGGNGSYRTAAVSYGFVTITDGGVLDNAQIICNVFPQSYLYTTEMTLKDENDRVPYGYSAVIISDNSTISNCYIYGARNNIQVGEGNVTIENTVTECGSLANIHIRNSNSSYTVTLKDLTTVQYVASSSFDTSAKVLGFGVLVGLSESESNPTIRLEGYLKQYNWVTNDHTSSSNVSSSYARTAIGNALKVTNYQHTVNGATTVNMGIVYLNSLSSTITDNRTDKATATYELNSISMSGYTGKVYSVVNGGDTSKAPAYGTTYNETYTPNAHRDTRPTLVFDGANGTSIKVVSAYENGVWSNTLNLDLDNISGGSYTVNFNNLKVQKYGTDLTYTIKDTSGNVVDKNTTITFNALAKKEYTLVVTDNLIYNQNGELTGESKTMEVPFLISATKTSIDPPKFVDAGTATAIRLVEKAGGDWRPAYEALKGITVTYWSASQSKVATVQLDTLYNKGTINSNVWTYTCDDFTLTITGGQVHSDGSKITPVVSNNTLYFASTNKAFTTSTTSRSIILAYVFTDKNLSNTYNLTKTVNYSDLSEYDYSKFKNGTLEAPSSSSGGTTCLAEGTLITLADGTKERIENLRKGNLVMSLDHLTGKITASEVIIVVKTASEFYKNTFVFDDGTQLVTINEHGIFDLDLNKYVNIDHENYTEYLGHNFVSIDSDGNIGVKKLVNVVSVFESGYKYDIVTDQTLNYVAEDTLSVTHVLVDVINTFDFGANLTYDQQAMQEDIEKYGLYTYDEWEEYCDISVFEEYNIPVMNVGISKGLYTKEYIIYLINTFVLDDSVQIL